MKRLPTVLLAAAVFAATGALRAAVFEGVITLKMSGNRGESHQIVQHLKDGYVRMDIGSTPGEMGAMIMDSKKREMIIMMPGQKMYLVRPMSDFAAIAEKVQDESSRDYTFEKTGETENILGYKCTKYVSTSKDGSADLWLTEELGRFMGLGSGGNPMARKGRDAPKAGWEQVLAGKDFFPLRVVGHDKKGAENFRMEAVAIDKSPQPASVFEPPADYQKLDIGGMMQGMGLPSPR